MILIQLTYNSMYIIIIFRHMFIYLRLDNFCFMLRREGITMSNSTRVRKNESIENALRRFKRNVSKSGTLQEYRKREYYEKPSVRRKLKSEAARKRKY